MDQPPDPSSTPAETPPRRKRRILRGVAIVSLVIIVFVAALPWMLGTGIGRRLMVRVVNGRLRPGQVDLARVSLSWTRPIELGNVVLIDPSGKQVLAARKVRTDRGILGLLTAKGNYGTITIEGATVAVERRADGSIDLLDALAGLNKPNDDESDAADSAVAVVINGGRFRIITPEMPEGLAAEAFRGAITIVPGNPIDATLTLVAEGRSLVLHAIYDHRAPKGTAAYLGARLIGKDWPIAVRQAGLTARGRFLGEIEARRRAGLWSAGGKAELREAIADGPILAGDRVKLASVMVDCDVAQSITGWTIGKFGIKSPIASIKAIGAIPATVKTPARLEGHADLAALARMLPNALPLRDGLAIERGMAHVEADLVSTDGTDRLQVAARVADLAAVNRGQPLALRDPASLSGTLTRAGGKVAVERFSLRAIGIDATATGDLDQGLTLVATADLAATQGQLREWLELGALDVAGNARIKADYHRKGAHYQARFATEIAGLRVSGLTDTPIARDHARIEGIADGPSSPIGVPTGWLAGRVGIVGGDAKVDLHATDQGDALALVLGASIPLDAPIPARAEARIALRRSSSPGPIQDIDELRLALVPTDPQAAPARIALATRGRIDLAAGELTLSPIANEPGTGIALAPEGLKIGGFTKPGLPLTIDAALIGELAALDRTLGAWTQSKPYGVGGDWAGRMSVTRGAEGVLAFDGGISVAHLVATTRLGPVSFGLKGEYAPGPDLLHLAKLDLSTLFGRLAVAGNIAGATGARQVDLTGNIEPRWEALDRLVVAAVEPGAQVRATGRPFHVWGPVAGGSASQMLRALDGEIGIDLASARAFGLVVGPTPIVLRLDQGRGAFDPIRTTLNDGTVEIAADLILDDPDALALRLAKGSKIDGATINAAVSQDILSYIAPVLSQATEVRGKVSLALDDSIVPILGDGSMRAQGNLAFQDVVFQPGAFAAEVFGLAGLGTPKMRLNQTLQVRIADGRVHQDGLTIAAGGDAKVKIGGSVGFDKTLALRASVPVTGRMLGGDKRLNQIVGDTQITVPIGGTLSHPAIDRGAAQVALKDAAKSMVRRGVQNGLGDALDRVVPSLPGGGAKPAQGRGRSLIGGDALKVLEGVGRDLIDPKKKP